MFHSLTDLQIMSNIKINVKVNVKLSTVCEIHNWGFP